MRVIQTNDDVVTLELTSDELMAAANAFNEVLNGADALDDLEFTPLLGVTRDEAERVHEGFLSILRQ